MQLITPLHWQGEYELIDSGAFEKLERFGKYTLARPEPQAIWDKALPDEIWNAAHARFVRDKTGAGEKGEWRTQPSMPGQWYIGYSHNSMSLKFRLGLSAFKHVGLFPEQAENWEYIYDAVRNIRVDNPKVLNLFAYTGGATLAAKAAGAEVVHVDAVRQVIHWAKDNMEASKQSDVRWIVEDAVKYVRREVKRGSTYQGIILDPPAYGRGPDGEKWVLEEHLNELVKLCKQLLDVQSHFFILNLYSMGYSALLTENLVRGVFGSVQNAEMGELYLPDRSQRKLPLGIFYRFKKM